MVHIHVRKIILLILILFVVCAVPIFASYSATITIINNSVNNYSEYPLMVAIDNAALVSGGYSTATQLDVQIGYNTLPTQIMPTQKQTWFINGLNTGTTDSLTYTMGNTPATQHYIITGKHGSITTLDNAALEPVNNFNFTTTGYLHTDFGNSIVHKVGAFIIAMQSATNIEAAILAAEASKNTAGSSVASGTVYGVNWRGEAFTTTSEFYLSKVVIYAMANTGTPPVGNGVTLSLRTSVAGVPTGSDIASVTNTSWTASATNTFTFNPPIHMVNATDYALVLRMSGGDAGNYITWAYDALGGTGYNVSADSGATWTNTAGRAHYYNVYGCAISCSAVVAGINSGKKIIVADADTVNLALYVYDSTLVVPVLEGFASTALGGASVPNNANNWIYGDAYSYYTYISQSVSGVEKLHYHPTTILASSTSTYTTGTATFTNGSATVTGSGTAWTANMVGGQIQDNTDAVYYTIAAVNSATSITLQSVYTQTGHAGVAFTLNYYPTATLIDEDATQNGTINFGYNPTDVLVSISSLTTGSNLAPPSITDSETQDIAPVIGGDYTLSTTNPSNPLTALIDAISTALNVNATMPNLPTSIIWLVLSMAAIVTAMVLALKFLQNQLIAAFAGAAVCVLFYRMNTIPLPIIIFMFVGFVTVIVWERKPSV